MAQIWQDDEKVQEEEVQVEVLRMQFCAVMCNANFTRDNEHGFTAIQLSFPDTDTTRQHVDARN